MCIDFHVASACMCATSIDLDLGIAEPDAYAEFVGNPLIYICYNIASGAPSQT